jgi:hypothetical protein
MYVLLKIWTLLTSRRAGGIELRVELDGGCGGRRSGRVAEEERGIGRGGATHQAPPCPVRRRFGWRLMAVSCRLREPELKAAMSCGGEERQPTMAATEEKATTVSSAAAATGRTGKFRQPDGVMCEIHQFLGFLVAATGLSRRTIFGIRRLEVADTKDQHFWYRLSLYSWHLLLLVSIVLRQSIPIISSYKYQRILVQPAVKNNVQGSPTAAAQKRRKARSCFAIFPVPSQFNPLPPHPVDPLCGKVNHYLLFHFSSYYLIWFHYSLIYMFY